MSFLNIHNRIYNIQNSNYIIIQIVKLLFCSLLNYGFNYKLNVAGK